MEGVYVVGLCENKDLMKCHSYQNSGTNFCMHMCHMCLKKRYGANPRR